LGAPDQPGFYGRRHGHFRRWQMRMSEPAPPVPPRVDVVGSLELNQRQREIYDDVVARANGQLAAPELAEALSILGREPFDRAAPDSPHGRGDLADAFEPLPHTFTPGQRAKLRDVASA